MKHRMTTCKVCMDCYVRSANDEVQSDEHETQWLRACAEHSEQSLEPWCLTADHHDVITGEHFHSIAFSRVSCEWCGTTLAGERFCAAILNTINIDRSIQ